MKRFSYYFTLLVTMLCCGSFFTSCDDDDDEAKNYAPQVNVKLIEASATSALFEVESNNVAELAYVIKEAGKTDPTNEIIFAKGTHFQATNGQKDTLKVEDLDVNSNLALHVAAKDVHENLLDKIVSVYFKTTDFTETITVVNRKYDGFTMHVKVPAEMRANNHAIRFTRGVLPFYNMLKMQGTSDAEMLLSNGGNERSTEDKDNVTYTFDEANSIIVDEETGEQYEIDSPIVPGEPSVFLAGEFSYGESPYGWGEGYFVPCFDTDKWFEDQFGGGGMILGVQEDSTYAKENSYWTGFHHREVVYSKQPALLNGGVKVDTLQLTPINASLRFTPDENVASYCVFVCDDALFNDMIMPMLDNDEKYLQWFTTSFMAFSQLGAMSFNTTSELNLDEFFEEGFVQPELKFHVLLTALGDENGESQSFQHLEIITPQRTKEAPVIAVKGIENPEGGNSPYEVWFNIKNVSDIDLAKGKFVANYEREMEAMFSNGYDEGTLIEESGQDFTEEDIEQINSEEGLNVRFDSRADACTYFIAMGYNDEGLNSDPVLGKNRSKALSAQEPVNSPYFKELQGEWTASVMLSHLNYATREWEKDSLPTLFKVNIGNNMSYPETLSSDVYDMYKEAGFDKPAVDKLYDEFKTLSNDYANRLKEQNCMLCTGFNIEGKADADLEFKTPYELFADKDYNGYNNEALFYDFGPKWFLHITEDGVSVPINTDFMAPFSNWKTDGPYRTTYYLVGLGKASYVGTPNSSEEEWASFPVEVSDNMDTIVVKPLEETNDMGKKELFYPGPVYMRYGQAMPAAGSQVVSEITLTKGWNGEVATMARNSRSLNNVMSPIASFNGKSIVPMVRPMGRTPLFNKQANVKRVKITHRVTSEEFKQGMLKLANQWLKGQQIQK